MKKSVLTLVAIAFLAINSFAQVAINTTGAEPSTSAILDLSSTSKGLLVPRMSTDNRTNDVTAVEGLLVYDTDTDSFWYYDGTQSSWIEVKAGSALNINSLADGKTVVSSVYLGNEAGYGDIGDNQNTGIGYQALTSNVSGWNNVAVGYHSSYNSTTAKKITANGCYSLNYNTTGSYNSAYGYASLYYNTTGQSNVAIGTNSLYRNTTRSNLVAIGDSALYYNGYGATGDTEATANVAVGSKALFSNTTGNYNVGIGPEAMYHISTGSENTAVGYQAGWGNYGYGAYITGCVSIGHQAGRGNSTSNKLFIDNSSTLYPLIGGDFTADRVDINGTIKITGGSAGDGKVLTSDVVGNASWEDPDVSYWELSGNNIYNLNSNGVGVGTTSPLAKLHVKNESTANMISPLAIFEYSGSGNSAGAIRVQNSAGNNYNFGITPNTDNVFEIAYSNNIGMGAGIFRITSTGDVSIDGTIKIEGGSPGIGKVLTSSNAEGLAVWGTLPTGVQELNDLSDAKTNASNVFVGNEAGSNDYGNNYNTAMGVQAMEANTSGQHNTAFGYKALEAATAEKNTAFGQNSMRKTSSGFNNTAVGQAALYENLTGDYNTAVGQAALYGNPTGNKNTAVGHNAFFSGTYSNSTAIGYNSEISGNDQVRLGNIDVTSIGGYAAWTTLTTMRSKINVTENVAGLDFILKLRPVTYSINHNSDAPVNSEKVYSGFVAQEVKNAADDLGYEFNGVDIPKDKNDNYGIRYSEFVVPLVKSVQELNEKLEKENAELKARLDRLEQLLIVK